MKRRANRPKQLRYFEADASRLAKLADPRFYQMNLSGILETALAQDPNLFQENGDLLPSWSKFAADPDRAKGFFVHMLQAMFEGKHGHDEVNLDLQVRRNIKAEGSTRVGMMFLPGSITNENLARAEAIAQIAIPGALVKALYGETTTNAKAERDAKAALEKAKNSNISTVLFLSAGMAQRSFSVGEITEVYLAYDGGDAGATIQKMSRALTPWGRKANKVARIVSLSFDPNRDDKFDAIVLETAKNYKAAHPEMENMQDALALVLRTLDIFHCTVDGAQRLDTDAYLAEALERRSIDRVIGKVAHIENLTDEELQAISEGNAAIFRAPEQERTMKGKTRNTPRTSSRSNERDLTEKQAEKLRIKVREVLVTVAENIDIIRYQGGGTLTEAFELLAQEPQDVRDAIEDNFGVPFEIIRALFDRNILNADLLDLKFASQQQNRI